MKLLVFTEYFPTSETEGITGGVESRAFHLLRELAKQHTVTVICSRQPKQEHTGWVSGIHVLRVGPVIPYSNEGNVVGRFLFAGAAFLTGWLVPCDVVEGYSYLVYPVAALLGKLRGKRTVATYHESWSLHDWIRLKGWITGLFGSCWTSLSRDVFDQYIAVSGITKQQLIAQGIPAKKISVVHNGVDLAFFAGINAKKFPASIMCSARLIKSKRVDVLIEAAALLKEEFPKLRVTIHGDGEERASLEKLIAKRKLTNVTITGRIPSFKRVNELRKRHEVFCLPSEVEGFGMVIPEAMALGLPVVCTDIPVLHEVTQDKGVLFFHSGNAHDLAKQLRRLLTDSSLRAQKAKEALLVAQAYDWKRLARQVKYG